MLSKRLQVIVLAAGESARFNTGKTKLLEPICGQEMILYTTKLLEQLSLSTALVTGYQRDLIQTLIRDHHGNSIQFAVQEKQQGTGHAVMCSKQYWNKDFILVMNGDMPLVTPTIIEDLYHQHVNTHATISFVIAHHIDPDDTSYGRVIKNKNSIEIVEAKHFQGNMADSCCVNAGIYIIDRLFLQEYVHRIGKNEVSQEFYITDLIKIAYQEAKVVTTYTAAFDQIRGINTFQELWAVEQIKRSELIRYWMSKGVRFSLAHTVHLDIDVQIGAGTFIGSGVHIQKGAEIRANVIIGENSIISNSIIENHVRIEPFSVIKNSTIHAGAHVGPFAHISDESSINERAWIGNFVEVKRSTVGAETRVKHLSYLGDAIIGNNVNIGAGTITCNHDGAHKNSTIIHDNAYIGSNNTLVAPVTIQENAFTGAGSVITKLVPAGALAIARARQVNKEDYNKKNEKNTVSEQLLRQITRAKEADFFVGAKKTQRMTTEEK